MTNSTMTCEAFDVALPDHLEGTLDGSLRSAVEGHLRECVRCAGLVRDLRNIEAEAAKLPDLEPSRDLWQGIEGRIAAPIIPLATRPERARRVAPAWMGVAAAALILTTAGVTYTLTARSLSNGGTARLATTTQVPAQQDNDRDSLGSASAVDEGPLDITSQQQRSGSSRPSALGVARNGAQRSPGTPLVIPVSEPLSSEAVYGKEIEMLQKVVGERKTQLDSTTIAIIERNLQIIDRAIEQSKAALARDPASRLLSEQLTHALDKKVELLRTAAMLPANT